MRRAIVQRALGFRQRACSRAPASALASVSGGPSGRREALADRRVNAVELQPASGATAQIGHGCRVVIVEVRAGREQLDRFETVRGDFDQVFAAEPLMW